MVAGVPYTLTQRKGCSKSPGQHPKAAPVQAQYRPVTVHRSLSRPSRGACLLALLAVLAQLWMVQLSHRHLAQQASAWLQWGEVCSTQNLGTADSSGSTDPMGGMSAAGCPVCALAGAGTVPSAAFQRSDPAPRLAGAETCWHHAESTAERERGVRPPAQAPPQAA